MPSSSFSLLSLELKVMNELEPHQCRPTPTCDPLQWSCLSPVTYLHPQSFSHCSRIQVLEPLKIQITIDDLELSNPNACQILLLGCTLDTPRNF